MNPENPADRWIDMFWNLSVEDSDVLSPAVTSRDNKCVHGNKYVKKNTCV